MNSSLNIKAADPDPDISEDEETRIALKHYHEGLDDPIEDKPLVAADTEKEREKLWKLWILCVLG